MSRFSFIGVMFLFMCSCQQNRTPDVFEIPKDYKGWVVVEYKNPECEQLRKIEDKWRIKVPSDGYICTSNKQEFGWASDEYYWGTVLENMRADPMIQGGGTGTLGCWASGKGKDINYRNFFVGDKENMHAFGFASNLSCERPHNKSKANEKGHARNPR